MAKKQQIILLHGSEKFTDKSVISKGELVIEHGASASEVKLHTLDNNGEIASFVSQAYVDSGIQAVSDKVNGDITTQLQALNTAISNEETARKNADSALETAYKAADADLDAAYKAADEALETDYKAADAELSLKITANESKITILNGDVTTSGSVAKAVNDAKSTLTSAYEAADIKIREDFASADADLLTAIGEVDAALTELSGKHDNEIASLQSADTANLNAAKSYTDALANGAVATNTSAIADNAAAIKAISDDYLTSSDKTELSNAISAEKSRAEGAESALSSSISGEASTREAADNKIREDFASADDAIKALMGTPTSGKTVVEMITEEVSAREGAISGVQNQINNLGNTYATDAELEAAVSSLESKITTAQKKSTTNVVEGTDAGNNMEISEALSSDGALVYTINLTDVASKNSLDATITKVNTLVGSDSNKSVRTIANEELAAQLIPENAADSLNELKEIAAWIQSHPGDASAMNEAIQANATAIADEVSARETAVSGVQGQVNTIKGDYLKSADKTELSNAISNEASARETADNAIKALMGTPTSGKTVVEMIAEEVSARETAVSGVQNQINKLGDTYATDAELSSAVSTLETKIAEAKSAATTTIKKGTDAGDHMTITPATVEGGAIEYTISLSDVASASSLTAAEGRISTNEGKLATIQGTGAGSIAKALEDAKAYADGKVSAEASAREAADSALQAAVNAKAESSALTAVDGRLATVEANYVKEVKVTTNGETKTYKPVNNILDLSELVIDGGTY